MLPLLAVTAYTMLQVSSALALSDFEQCVSEFVQRGRDDLTLGEIRDLCRDKSPALVSTPVIAQGTEFEQGALRQQLSYERQLESTKFSLSPHAPNYIVYSVMDEANQAPYAPLADVDDPVQDQEAVFQVSFKAPIARDVFGSGMDAYVAYTSRSWWQIANDDFSSPFRETNYEPEIFLRNDKRRQILGMSLEGWSLGFVHESNGREQVLGLSRSWNRVEGRAGIQLTPNVTMGVRAWYRVPEDEEDDDNPGMYKYRGYGDVRAIWTPNRSTVTAMINPATERANFELTWSYPIGRAFRIYTSYYDGNGESLLDYDFEIQRFSIGVALNDFVTRY